MDMQNSLNFSPKISPKIMFSYTSMAAKSSFANIDGPLTVCYMTQNANFFEETWIFNSFQNSLKNIIQYVLKILKGFIRKVQYGNHGQF